MISNYWQLRLIHYVLFHYDVCSEEAKKDADKIHRITFIDRLRFVECICSDEVREMYMASGNSMNRDEMEVRNHIDADPNFQVRMCNLFNNEDFKPFSTAYPNLHSDFVQQMLLEKGEYTLTQDRCKYILGEAKPQLVEMINRYERSGMGAMSRYDEAAEWGEFTIEKCDGIDDRSRFLLRGHGTHLLYYWAKLIDSKMLSFTCNHLHKKQTATTENVQSTQDKNRQSNNNATNDKSPTNLKHNLNENVAMVGQSLHDMARVEMSSRLDALHDRKFDLQFKMEEYELAGDDRKFKLCEKHMEQLDQKIDALEEQLGIKRQKVAEESNSTNV